MAKLTELTVNGMRVRVDAAAAPMLLQALREQAGLVGAKYGCGEGQCGACTVLVEGEPMRSCLTRVDAVAGKRITTVEGLAEGGVLHPLQQAFLDVEALQCGYCTPGMVVEGVALLRRSPRPDREEIVRAMEGHICRCGAYPRIVAAIERASGGEVESGEPTGGAGQGARR